MESSAEFSTQPLGVPFEGQHVGVTHVDLNNDGLPDLLFAAGRHWIDQPFALINLGVEDGDDDHGGRKIRFSSALPIGDPGGYYTVDASRLSNLPESNWGVMLAGATCQVTKPNRYGRCERGRNSPAILLNVSATGCSAARPGAPCRVAYSELWRDPSPRGDRNGGFAPTLGNGVDAAIVLTGQGGVAVFVPNERGTYGAAAFRRGADPRPRVDPRSDLARYSGFAAGCVGIVPGLVAGARSDYEPPPNPSLVVVRTVADGMFHGRSVDVIGGGPYEGNASYALQPTGLAVADLNGDGIGDVVEANFLYPDQVVPGHPLPQRVYLLNRHGEPVETLLLLNASRGGRSVAVGHIFDASPLPDVALATAGGTVILFANLGTDADGSFLGFRRRSTLRIDDPSCEIRDVDVVSLSPCSVSVVCAVTCGWTNGSEKNSGNYAFHGRRGCATAVEHGAHEEDGTIMSTTDGHNIAGDMLIALVFASVVVGVAACIYCFCDRPHAKNNRRTHVVTNAK